MVIFFSQRVMAHRGVFGIALLRFNLGARKGWVVKAKPRPLYPPGRVPVPIEEGWVAPRIRVLVKRKSHGPQRESNPGQSSP